MLVDVLSIPSSPTHRQRYPLLVGLMLGLVGVCLSACAQEEPVTRTASHDVQSWQPAHLPQPISRNPEFVKRLEQSPTSQQTSASSSASRSKKQINQRVRSLLPQQTLLLRSPQLLRRLP